MRPENLRFRIVLPVDARLASISAAYPNLGVLTQT